VDPENPANKIKVDTWFDPVSGRVFEAPVGSIVEPPAPSGPDAGTPTPDPLPPVSTDVEEEPYPGYAEAS
jgi:hypothetical protein